MINSILTKCDNHVTVDSIAAWLEERDRKVNVKIDPIPFLEMRGLRFVFDCSLCHESGKFFR